MMTTVAADLTFRQGSPADVATLTELVNLAGEGMPLRLWECLREGNETAWDVGRRRSAQAGDLLSYRNAVIAEEDGEIAGVMIGYPQAPELEPIDYDGVPAAIIPMQELEHLTANTWYVNVLAVFPSARRRGLAMRFMEIAEAEARRKGKPGVSVIVSDANAGAKQFYLGCGYRQVAMRPMVRDWGPDGTSWVLLTKML